MVLLSIDWTNLHELLRSLYDEMMPLCEDMASVAKGVAGIGALFYVAYRVWQSLARAEEIDVFPLFRPFVLGLCIMFFPTMVLGTINGILSPVCSATSSLVERQTFDIRKKTTNWNGKRCFVTRQRPFWLAMRNLTRG